MLRYSAITRAIYCFRWTFHEQKSSLLVVQDRWILGRFFWNTSRIYGQWYHSILSFCLLGNDTFYFDTIQPIFIVYIRLVIEERTMNLYVSEMWNIKIQQSLIYHIIKYWRVVSANNVIWKRFSKKYVQACLQDEADSLNVAQMLCRRAESSSRVRNLSRVYLINTSDEKDKSYDEYDRKPNKHFLHRDLALGRKSRTCTNRRERGTKNEAASTKHAALVYH